MAKKNPKDKFEFGVDFQKLILQLTVTDKIKGPKLLRYYEDTYFTLIEHSIIAELLKKYSKKYKRIPSQPILREALRVFYRTNKLAANLDKKDKATIDEAITEIYSHIPAESDEIIEKTINFARYVNFKAEIEQVDINNQSSYEAYADKLKRAHSIGMEIVEDKGTWLVKGMKDRAFNRDDEQGNPLPFWQLNHWFNSGGLGWGNLIVLMSEQKRFKTGGLINLAIGYLRMRKRVLYIDFENGEKALTTRSEQSVANVDQKTILSSDIDKKLMKLFRRYGRLRSELVIKRMTAYKDSAQTIQSFMNKLKQEDGMVFDVVMVDYADLAASSTGVVDDTKRISDVYVDLKNLANDEKLEAIYTASHVTRTASEKRLATRYLPGDVSKCIDKMSHVDLAIGIQESPEEKEAGVMRWEVVLQRNGAQQSKALFWVNIAHQRLKEFTPGELKEYNDQLGIESPIDKDGLPPKKKTKTHGDI